MNKLGGIWNPGFIAKEKLRDFSRHFALKMEWDRDLMLFADESPFDRHILLEGSFFKGEPGSEIESIQNGKSPDEGAYAVIEYLPADRKLILQRDPVGICTLYYLSFGRSFIFSNRSDLLFGIIGDLSLNYRAVFDFMVFNKQGINGDSLVEGIVELDPTQRLIFDLERGRIHHREINAFHSLEDDISPPGRSFDVERQWLFQSLQQSVHSRLANPGRSGCLLSGGLDSSVLATTIYSHIEMPGELDLFTAGFPGWSGDESEFAREVHQSLSGSRWNLVTPDKDQFIRDIEELHRALCIPTLSVGSYLQFRLLQEASQAGVDRIFDGTGADALFAGHWHHWAVYLIELLKSMEIAELMTEFSNGRSHKNDISLLLRFFLKSFGLPALPKTFKSRIYRAQYGELKYMNKDFLNEHQDRFALKIDEMHFRLKRQLNYEYTGGPVRHLLHFPVYLSRHFGIDLVCPFSDNLALARKVMSWPANFKISGGSRKYILREAFKSQLPQRIYGRKEKLGLVSPNNEWISQLKDSFRIYFTDENADVFNLDLLMKDYDKIFEIRHHPENYRIFKLISFVIWRSVFSIS